MIYRIFVGCPGCKSSITLRLQVGYDSRQPFYFVCQKCGAPTKGALNINYETDPPITKIDLEDAKLIADYMDETDQTITIAADLPCLITPHEDPVGQSPFLYQSELIEDPDVFLGFIDSVNSFRSFISADWIKFRRLISYYLDRNWNQFGVEWKNILGEEAPIPDTELDRHDQFHRALEFSFIFIQSNFDYPVLKKELAGFVNFLAEHKNEALIKYVNTFTDGNELLLYQTKLLERLSFMADNFSALVPAFPIMFYSNEKKHNLGEIRIMRDDFEVLKSHYLSCFEICHKVLKLPIGMINIFLRGDADAFPDGKPVELKSFDEPNFSSAQKIKCLDPSALPELASRWEIYFDRKLRNAIGHYSVRHDLKTGMLILDNADPIPYSFFVVNTLTLSPLILYCLQMVKMMYIMKIILVDRKNIQP